MGKCLGTEQKDQNEGIKVSIKEYSFDEKLLKKNSDMK